MNLASSIKSLGKIILQSRPCTVKSAANNSRSPIVVMGNGPSLRDTMRTHLHTLQSLPSIAVNFAGNSDEFLQLKPRYYILADPHFFHPEGDANVERLWSRFNELVTWPMTLMVPARERKAVPVSNPNVKIVSYNPVGVEGWRWLRNWAYRTGLGMPRPRNVLIPAIMMAIKLGYKDIYIVGADHSWMETLSVDSQNRVVSVQPHFYNDNKEEQQRVSAVYNDVRLHDIIQSFYVAFRAYHYIQDYALSHNIHIYNSTPHSFIDAFPRRSLPGITP